MENETPRTSIRKPSALPLVLVVLGMVAAAAGGLWLYLRGNPPPPPAGATATAAPDPTPAAAAPVDPARQRTLLEGVSSNPLVRTPLAAPEAARRIAVAVENLANDVVPRKQLESLAPKGPFAVVRRDGRTFMDPEAGRRFDAVGDAVASVNVDALVVAWAAVRPAVDAAYRSLGYPDGGLDAALGRTLHRIEHAPVPDGPVEVKEGPGTSYVLADPALERLGDVEKQVLRLGARNARIVREKALEIARALGLQAAAH